MRVEDHRTGCRRNAVELAGATIPSRLGAPSSLLREWGTDPAGARIPSRTDGVRPLPYGGGSVHCGSVSLALLLATLLLPGCQVVGHGPWQGRSVRGGVRAIWVTRWDYKTARDISAVMENCKQAGFNTVLFQVRGAAAACYRSKIEPWADEMGGRDPGFDPLAVACREAHNRGLSLHAWVNLIPGWFGGKPPTNPRHLWHTRPGWFWQDAAGRRQPLGWYCSLNPCYPEVRDYLVSVMREIVANYPIDGLHMDYVRYPNEWNKGYAEGATVPDYPRDPRTLSLFHSATRKTPDQAPAQWNTWRTVQLNILVARIREMMLQVRPQASLTAAVGAEPGLHLRNHFQDSRRWMNERWVDAVFPMNYEKDVSSYTRRVKNWASMQGSTPFITGIMFDKRDASLVQEQVARAVKGGDHFAAFAYNSLFERLDAGGRRAMDDQSPQRTELRRGVIPYLRHMAGTSR